MVTVTELRSVTLEGKESHAKFISIMKLTYPRMEMQLDLH